MTTETTAPGPCPCWMARSVFDHGHEGHCCFLNYDEDANRVTCGHDAAGMAIAEKVTS